MFQAGEGNAREPQGAALWRSVISTELARLARGIARVRELFPWTALGVVLTALAYGALEWFAYAQLDLVWLVVGYVGLGLTLLAPVLVLLAAGLLRARAPASVPAGPLVLETGLASDTGFALSALSLLPFVQVRWEWLAPQAAQVEQVRRDGVLHERVRVPERGRFTRIERRVAVGDAFGLCRVSFRLEQAIMVDVLPRLGALRAVPAFTALASGDAQPHPLGLSEGDRLELRRYVPGDPARFIHWKVLSRTGKLMVRVPERALSIARRTAAFVIAGPSDDASSAAARLAIEQRALGQEWVLGTDGDPAGVSRVDEALDLLMRSSRERARSGERLRSFVQSVERAGPASYVVFAPPAPGPWVERVAEIARGRGVRVVIGVDGLSPEQPRSWLQRLLLLPAPVTGVPSEQLEALVTQLARANASVSVLDRGSGRPLGAAHRQAMARLGAAVAGGA